MAHSWIKPRKRRYILPAYARVAKVFRERVEREFREEGLYDLVPASRRGVALGRTTIERVGTGEKVLLYLSRYVFRVAISNERILAYDGGRVTFRAKTRGNTGNARRRGVHPALPPARAAEGLRQGALLRALGFGLPAQAREGPPHPQRPSRRDRQETTSDRTARARSSTDASVPEVRRPYQDPPVAIPRSRGPP